MKNNRAGEIDLLRAFGIIIMIMGHAFLGTTFDKYIHAFHMPMWFFISGYFCNYKKNTKEYLIKKFKSLLVPYLFFGVLYETIWTFIECPKWLGLLYPNSIEVPLNGALWFLPALFFVDVVSFLVLKYIPKKLSYFLLFLIGAVGSIINIKELPLSLDSTFVGVGFFIIGYIIKNHFDFLLNINKYVCMLLFVFNTVLIFFNGNVNVHTNTYAIIPLFWLNAVLAIIIYINIFRYINLKCDLKVLKEIGQDSIIYVCMNQFMLYFLKQIQIPFISGSVILVLIWHMIMSFIVVALCFMLNRIIKKTPFKFIIGRF